jgi:uncharacterized protein (DUF2384 family)
MGRPAFGGYTIEDLRWRPIEHIVEVLPIRVLTRAAGLNRDEWGRIRRGERQVSDEQAARIRRYLERSLT